jgi:RNA polymerase sigma-70 factor (ECF subfamily)
VVFRPGDGKAGAAGALLSPLDQKSLAERVHGHEGAAEDELVAHFRERIVFLAIARTRDPEMARDVAQDVLVAVLLALRSGQLREPERLAGFVYGTARNVINNHLRNRGRLPRQDPIDAAADVADPSDAAEQAERVQLVQRSLAALDPLDRKILLLTMVAGLKPGEIGARLGLKSDVVRARKSRALKKTIERVRRLSRS